MNTIIQCARILQRFSAICTKIPSDDQSPTITAILGYSFCIQCGHVFTFFSFFFFIYNMFFFCLYSTQIIINSLLGTVA